MADIVYIAVIVAFFALSALFVRVCDRIIGADEGPALVSEAVSEEPVGARS